MHPRERVISTVRHREPDKVPTHINATKWVVEKLKRALQVDTEKELLQALHIDVYDMRGINLETGTVPRYKGPENEFFPESWGGNILSPGHPVLQDDVPVENIITMYETAYEYGFY